MPADGVLSAGRLAVEAHHVAFLHGVEDVLRNLDVDINTYLDFKIPPRDGKPVTIRLIDPPMHEFLPSHDELLIEVTELKTNGKDPKRLAEAEKVIVDINKTLPQGTVMEVTQDGGKDAENSLKNVIEALIFGAGLPIFVVYAFLNSWRSTLITALSLPTSVIAAFIVHSTRLMLLDERLAFVSPLPSGLILVASGIYRLSRNPMYLGMALALFGVSRAITSAKLTPEARTRTTTWRYWTWTPALLQPLSRPEGRRTA